MCLNHEGPHVKAEKRGTGTRRRAKPGRPATQAPQRQTQRDAPCPHHPRCDGCPLIGRPYGDQLRWKQRSIDDALARALGAGTVEVLPIMGSQSPFGYRNQAKLVLRQTRGGVIAGLYAPGTHDVIWDGKDASGQQVASGIYFYRLRSGDFQDTKKMVMMK